MTEPYQGAASAPHPTDHEGNHPVTEHEHEPAPPVDQDGPATDEAAVDGPAADGTATPDVATAAFGAGDEPVDAPASDTHGDDAAAPGPASDVAPDGAAGDADAGHGADQGADDGSDEGAGDGAEDGADDGPTSPSFEALVAGEPVATEPADSEPADSEPVDDEPVDGGPADSELIDGEPGVSDPGVSDPVVTPAGFTDHDEQQGADDADADLDVVEEPAPVVLSGPPSQRLVQLGIALPQVPAPVADYVPAVRSGAHVYTSGQLPFFDGQLTTTGVVGDEAVDVTPEEAAVLARQCALNAIAAVASVVDLDSVVRVVKVTGFVASAPGFAKQPVVVNGASALIGQVFGEAGKHARSAVGVAALPLGAPVEVELVVEVA